MSVKALELEHPGIYKFWLNRMLVNYGRTHVILVVKLSDTANNTAVAMTSTMQEVITKTR